MEICLPQNWWLKYLGKPWEASPHPPQSYNCGELVRAVHIDLLGIDSPLIPVTNANSPRQCLRAMQPEFFGLLPLAEGEKPHSLDVAFLGRQKILAHCGVAVETLEGLKVLQCPQVASGVVLDDLVQLRIFGFPEIRWFRHQNLHSSMRRLGILV